MPSFTSEQLIQAGTILFSAAGTPDDEARIVARLLTEANCAGHDSHGIIRIPDYLQNVESGEAVPGAKVETVRETSITAVVDGHRGFGQVTMSRVVDLVLEKAVRTVWPRGEPAPDGWLLDHEGRPTNDPARLYDSDHPGSILPLGGSAAGHKGYGLNVALELLAGALSGTGCIGKDAPSSNGILLIALDIGQFLPLEEFYAEADRFAAHLKSSPPAAGVDKVLMPGEIERRVQKERARDGIYVEEETWQRMLDWANKLGVTLETPA